MDTTRIVYSSRGFFRRRFRRYISRGRGAAVARRCAVDPDQLMAGYDERIARYMDETDFGPDDAKYVCYLNVFTALVAYELMREGGFTEVEAFAAYDYVSSPMRKIAHLTHGWIDKVPHGFKIIRDSLISDLTGPKRICWTTAVLQNDDAALEYRITRCLYYDVCEAHGYPEFTRAFCDHDSFAYGGLRRHIRFTRFACFGDGDSCCHDRFERVR